MQLPTRIHVAHACTLVLLLTFPRYARGQASRTWTADNGNGTYSNPLFYDEFSDPDLIRVGSNYYLTGTTMHAMPGLPVLQSTDLVNWHFLGYALDRLDLGPAYRLEDGKDIYGQGIWAPSFRYRDGTFYIFSNVNGQTTQLFRATNPRGPWTRTPMKRSLHDLSVLFDDDGKVYVVWGYRAIHFAQLDSSLTDFVPGTDRVVIAPQQGMGEGSHFYRIHGKYYILSAWFNGHMRLVAARADRPDGPYEVNPAVSIDEDFGLRLGYRLRSNVGPPFAVAPPDSAARGRLSLHQGGIVETPEGEWWGFSMMDYNSVGRLTALSPVTWQDGWPYFGLPGNLGRTPRIWVKPRTGSPAAPHAPYVRSDDFSGPTLHPIWQWNHVPDDARWSLTERRGFLRLYALPAPSFWHARNSLTQRAIGPASTATTVLETTGMRAGDVAGLALLNLPYAWIGVARTADGYTLERFDQTTDTATRVPLHVHRVWLRVACDFLTEHAHFSYSTDGRRFTPLGGEFTMIFQLKTFQGVRYALFDYDTAAAPGGYADFDRFDVYEPHPRGLMRPIPMRRTIVLRRARGAAVVGVRGDTLVAVPAAPGQASAGTPLVVVDRGLGRVALRVGRRYVSVEGAGGAGEVVTRVTAPGDAESFQWIETPYGELALMSLATHRYLRIDASQGTVAADAAGPSPDGSDGTTLAWRLVHTADGR